MRSRLAYGTLFLFLFLAAVIVQWPASTLLERAEQAGGGRWKIGGAEGTVWNGRATLLVAASQPPDGRGWTAVQNLRWRAKSGELWKARLAFEVALERGSLVFSIGSGGVAVENVDAQLPAAVLAAMIPGPVGRYNLDGMLEARAQRFACSTRTRDCRGEMDIVWSDAGIAEIQGVRLGNYSLHVVGEGSAVHFRLATLSGRLQISGNGEIGGGGLRFSGEAAAVGAGAGVLEAQLRTLGRRNATSGGYIIDYRDSMPR